MIESANVHGMARRFFRLARARPTSREYIDSLPYTQQERDELSAIASGIDDKKAILDEILSPLTRAFIPARGSEPTRFSNGSIRICYTALDQPTAIAEKEYHVRKRGGAKRQRFRMYSGTFTGRAADLVPLLENWPDLVSDDYSFCQLLGSEAADSGLDGLLAPSARNHGGINLPILRIVTVSRPDELDLVEFTL